MATYNLTGSLITVTNIKHSSTSTSRKYLSGDRLTVADSYAATVLIQAEWVGFSFRMWPRVASWLKRVRSQQNWTQVHTQHRELVSEIEIAGLLE